MTTSVVVYSTTADVWAGPYQRRVFKANGRYWLFYGDGTGLFWKTSTDGTTWSSAISVGSSFGTLSKHISVAFDGTYLHYVVIRGSTVNVYYRMGTPNADGTITWLAAEQERAFAQAGTTPASATIIVDSNGYPWIAVSTQTWAYIETSTTKNGTWTSGGSKVLDSGFSSGAGVFAVALSGGQVYAGSIEAHAQPTGFLYNGTTWGSVETLTTNLEDSADAYTHSIQAGPDDIIYFSYSSLDLTGWKCAIRSVAGVWSQTTITIADQSSALVSLSRIVTDIYAFYTNTNMDIVTYKKWQGEWGVPGLFVTETTDQIRVGSNLISSSDSSNSLGAIVFLAKTGATYDIKFAMLVFPFVSTDGVVDITATTATALATMLSLRYPPVSQHGHCWATTPNPTTADSKTTNGVAVLGRFTSAMTGLVAGKKYYVRAYATDALTTVYGVHINAVAGAPALTRRPGEIGIFQTLFWYVDGYGVLRYLEGTPA